MKGVIQSVFCCLFLLLSISSIAQAQVEGSSTEKEDSFTIQKRVPKSESAGGNTIFVNDGTAKKYYIVQLARFEKMYEIPSTFPKGTTLWLNPDIGVEALLITTQMYLSYEAAAAAAEKIKSEGYYPKAFARPHPFIVRYE